MAHNPNGAGNTGGDIDAVAGSITVTLFEAALLAHLAAGHSNARIAAIRSRSEKTVRNQLTRLYAKLRVVNRAQAVAVAVRNGWTG